MDTQEFRKLISNSEVKYARVKHDEILEKEEDRTETVLMNESVRRKYSELAGKVSEQPDFQFPLVNARYREMVMLFGPPDATGKDFAMWDNPSFERGSIGMDRMPSIDGIFTQLFIKGEMKPHNNHVDFLYTESKLQMDYASGSAMKIGKVSKSFYAEPSKDTVTAGCHFLGANLASIFIAAKVGMGMYDHVCFARDEYKALAKALRKENLSAKRLGEEYGKENHHYVISTLGRIYDELNRKPDYLEKESKPYRSATQEKRRRSLEYQKGLERVKTGRETGRETLVDLLTDL